VFYGIRSELMEQLNYNLMYRWFVGLSPDDPVWDPTTFTKNRNRLQNGEVFAKFMTKLLNQIAVWRPPAVKRGDAGICNTKLRHNAQTISLFHDLPDVGLRRFVILRGVRHDNPQIQDRPDSVSHILPQRKRSGRHLRRHQKNARA
jgi:hypothetical protein